jgi:3',5'-nucleoside bisphosphate phosphatase
MPRYDLHCHSTCSDGLLSPGDVVRRAAKRGVDVLALTDHDEVCGLAEARAAADEADICLVGGAELSVSWGDTTLHIVALHIDPECETLLSGLAKIREGRARRAKRMGDALATAGIANAYDGAMAYVTSERLISRTHFARFLVECGHARDTRDVFSRYLVRGKPGYVVQQWAALDEAVSWIHAAGGQAVLAHPGRYKIDGRQMRALLGEFRDLGGDAVEVLSSSHTAEQFTEFARHARVFGLLASSGSDYHGPGESWVDLGGMPPLPADLTPVWRNW